MSTSIETVSGPVPATACSAACLSAARSGASSEPRNGAKWAMPSRHAASSAGVASPVGTAVMRARTSVKPAAAALAASACGSLARVPGESTVCQAGGR